MHFSALKEYAAENQMKAPSSRQPPSAPKSSIHKRYAVTCDVSFCGFRSKPDAGSGLSFAIWFRAETVLSN